MAQNHRGLVGSARGVDSWSGDHNKSPLICISETALCTNKLSRHVHIIVRRLILNFFIKVIGDMLI